jgi:EAL domain-containing protein (putative c-di-GMP-specific phosphodiesterase class I)
MIAGLVNFAARVGSEVIAEGIEEQAELEMLVELGVTLGQGFLLGIPAPAVAGSASTGRPAPATNVRRRVGERTGAARPSSPRRRVSPALRVG